jgi:hypothetical protein
VLEGLHEGEYVLLNADIKLEEGKRIRLARVG